MKILIVRVGAMGDVLHALAGESRHCGRRGRIGRLIGWLIRAGLRCWWMARRDWPDREPRAPGGDEVMDRKRRLRLRTLRSILGLRKALRREQYDLAVDMQGTLRSAVIGWMSGAAQFAGYSDPREAVAARFYSQTLERKGTHVIEQGRRC
jgi:heptosyltransferase-1